MHGKWLFKEIKTEYGQCKVEIFRKGYTATAIEIGALESNSLTLAMENLGNITDPIGKSVCSFSIIDTAQLDYDDFFTPDATAYKVVVSTRVGEGAYVTRWSGYITPDFFAENLSYRTPISISARDNIGYLNDVDFDLDVSTITVRELIQAAFNRIAEDYPMQIVFATQKQTAEGILAIDATISSMLLREGTWYEAIETILHDLGLQMRWVDNNTIAVLDLSQIPEYYPTQGFNFIDASGYREILPAWRELSQEQDYGVLDNFYKGQIDGENKLEYAANSAISSNVLLYQPIAITPWNRQGEIYFLNFFNSYNAEIGDDKQDSIYITGVAPSVTNADVLNQKMVYSQAVTEVNKQIKMTFSLNDTLRTPLTSQYSRGERNTLYLPYSAASGTTMIRIPQPYQLKYRFNIFLRANDGTNYVMRDKWEELSTMTEQPFIEFLTDKLQTIDTGVTDGQGNHRFAFTGYDNSKEYSIIVGSIPKAGTLEFVVYPWTFEKDDYTSTRDEATFQRGAKITDIVFSVQVGKTGVSARTQVGVSHNIKSNVDYKFGQVPQREGDVITYAGGLFQSDTITALQGFQRNANATNYNLLELVGREVIHFNKKNYNKLSGTIRNLAKEPLMFNRLFVREGKKYAPFAYSLNVISNEMSITTMQEVEEYTTEQFSEINSVVTTGGATVGGGGNNTILQYSQDAGNTKRIYELSAATEQEKADAWVMVDNNSFGEAKKVNLKELGGLDEVELDFYLKNNHYATENWVEGKGYATAEGVANTYATKTQLGALEASHNSLRTEFDALNTLLNDDVSGKIDTWREVVDFLDEYSDSQDLATILAGLSGDIANRVLYSDFEKLEETVEGNSQSIGTISTNVTNLTTRVGNAEVAITTIQGNYVDKGSAQEISGVKTFKNGLKIGGAELVWDDTVKALKIIGNTYITENFSFGGYEEPEGGGSGGAGIVTIRVNGVDYSSYNGLVELPNYPSLAGYATESYVTSRGYITGINSTMVTNALGYTPYNSSNPSGYITSAALNGYATESWVGANYLGLGGGELNMPTFGNFIINSEDASINRSAMVFRKNGENKAQIGWDAYQSWGTYLYNYASYSVLGIKDDGTPHYNGNTLYHTGNFNPANYLPLSGGTISGDSYGALRIKRNISGKPSLVLYENAGGVLGYLGFENVDTPTFLKADSSAYYTLIHSGNIGSQSVGYASSAGVVTGSVRNPNLNYSMYDNTIRLFSLAGGGNGATEWGGGVSIISDYGGFQLQVHNYWSSVPNIMARIVNEDGWSSWRGLAFLDDNVASATKLQTASGALYASTDGSTYSAFGIRGLVNYFDGIECRINYGSSNTTGFTLNSSGNVLIGDTTDSGSKLSIYANGASGRVKIYSSGTEGLNIGQWDGVNNRFESYGRPMLFTAYDAKPIMFGFSGDGNALTLNPNGNVLIGTTSDNGYKLDVSGETRVQSANPNVLSIFRTSGGGAFIDYYARNSMVNQWRVGHSYEGDFYFGKFTSNGESILMTLSASGNLTVSGGATFGGNVQISGDLAFASDARLKDKIATVSAEESMNILRQLRPASWNWKKDGNRSYGLIAQEVAPILPDMVTNGEHLHLQYNHLHAFEIGAIQHIDSEVEQLKRKVAELENELKQYRRVM